MNFDEFKTTLQARFKADPEEAVKYLIGTLDRQINKAGGLLSFNALLFAAFTLVTERTARPSLPIEIGRITTLLVPVPTLLLLWVRWGTAAEHESAATDVASLVSTLRWRTWLVKFAVIGSIVNAGLALWTVQRIS